jgi:hypothetical protein
MGTVLAEKIIMKLQLKTAHSKRVILSVLPSLLQSATLPFSRTFTVTYCL